MTELEYRLAAQEGGASGAWTRAPNADEGREVEILGLTEGATYEVRARIVGPTGYAGAWVYGEPVIASRGLSLDDAGAAATPAPVENVRIERDGCLYFDHPAGDVPGRDLAGYEVRQASDDYQNHDGAVDVSGGLVAASPVSMCGVPRGLRTLSVVAVFPNGAKSVPTYLPVDRGDHDEGETVEVETHNEHAAWTGVKVAFTSGAGVLTQDAATVFFGADEEPLFGPAPSEFFAGRVAEASYQWLATPTTPGDTNILTMDVTIAAPGWRAEYRRDDTRFFGPDSDPFFGVDAVGFFAGTTEDEQFFGADGDEFFGGVTSPFFSSTLWRAWPGRLVVRDYEAIWARVVIPGGSRPAGVLSALTWRVTRPTAPTAAGVALIEGADAVAQRASLGLSTAPRLLWVQTADVTVGNTASQKTLLEPGVGSLTLPAEYVAGGTTIVQRHFAAYSTKTPATGTLTIEAKLGGVSLGSVACDVHASITALRFRIDAQWTIRTIGTSGSIMFCAKIEGQNSSGGGADSMDIFSITVLSTPINWSTNTRVIDLLATWATAHADNTITTRLGYIEAKVFA